MERSSGPEGRADADAPVEWLPGRPSRREVMRRLEALRLYQATEEGRAEAIERARSIAAHASGLAGAIEADDGARIEHHLTAMCADFVGLTYVAGVADLAPALAEPRELARGIEEDLT